jgi:predicted ATPase
MAAPQRRRRPLPQSPIGSLQRFAGVALTALPGWHEEAHRTCRCLLLTAIGLGLDHPDPEHPDTAAGHLFADDRLRADGGNVRPVISAAFLRSVRVRAGADEPRSGYPWGLPAIRAVAASERGLELHEQVTYLIGENGSGKSTLLEAIATAAGMNPEGGSSNFAFSTRESHSPLGDSIVLVRGTRRPRTDFFLRAESLFTAATYLEQIGGLAAYGGRSLHEQSHGESFLAVMLKRFGPDGLYLLDEPEAALSTQNCLTFLRRVHQLVRDGSQFVIATHSPIILAYPNATIYEFSDAGVRHVPYEDAEPVRLTHSFLAARGGYLAQILSD